MQAVFFILSVQKLGASGVAVGEVCSFDGVELWEWGVQQYFGLSALVELQSSEYPWEESCSSLIWTIHKKLQVVLLHLLWGTYGWSWRVLVHSRVVWQILITCCFIVRLESRINPKFPTLSENRISRVPTLIDDGISSDTRTEKVSRREWLQFYLH